MYRFDGFTEKANNALNLALTSAEDMGHTYIGSEHIILGLLKENSGVAAEVLSKLGAVSYTHLDVYKRQVKIPFFAASICVL